MSSGLGRKQTVDGKMCRELLRSDMNTATVLRDTEKAVQVISCQTGFGSTVGRHSGLIDVERVGPCVGSRGR